jgi:endonuclease G
VVTGPVLKEGLAKIERGVNKVSIPQQYFKVVADFNKKKAIGFLLPNEAISKSLKMFATDINSIEALTGLNFFNKVPEALQEELEKQSDPTAWLPQTNLADADALPQETLPRNHFNTDLAKQWIGHNDPISVCGTVVGARLSKAGNMLINLDKQFPNQVFTVFIKKEDIVNFDYDLTSVLKNKVICVKGKVFNQGGTPTMNIQSQADLKVQE